MTITDSPTETPTVCVGQTWKRNGYGFRHLVLDTPEVEGIRMVLYRLDCDPPGEAVRCATVDEFLAEHEDPQWPTPEPTESVWYAVMVDGWDGRRPRRDGVEFASLDGARERATELGDRALGIQRFTITERREWIAVAEDGQ